MTAAETRVWILELLIFGPQISDCVDLVRAAATGAQTGPNNLKATGLLPTVDTPKHRDDASIVSEKTVKVNSG